MTGARELIFGTTNPAKVAQIQGAVADLGITIKALDRSQLLDVAEDGKTAEENARKKAVAYAAALGNKVFSMDNALYFVGVSDDEQPGLYVRRIGGREIGSSDQDMINHYSRFVSQHGRRMKAAWHFGIAIASPEGSCDSTTVLSPRIFTGEPSRNVVPGYPLESLQIEPESGRYIADMTDAEQADFWARTIGRQVSQFIADSLDIK